MKTRLHRRLEFLRNELDRLDSTGQSAHAIQQEIARLQARLDAARPAKALFQQMRHISTRSARRKIVGTVRLKDLPEDIQVLIADFIGDELDPDTEYSVLEIPTDAFPRVTGDTLDLARGVPHAAAMTDWKNMPPVLIHGDKWMDGRHRVYAARVQRQPVVQAIDLEEHGQRLQRGMEASVLGVVQPQQTESAPALVSSLLEDDSGGYSTG